MIPYTTNQLIHETSPYLLQHAHNPVNWLPWNKKSLEKAREEQKPILVSIGYSACHWCHVMEHESFEDPEVAALMNEYFICIKVDREERPDVDQVYMDAVQAMTGGGGWPLNCFAMPDGKPFFGGTYFPKKQWLQVLQKVAEAFEKERTKLEDYAQRLTLGLNQNNDMQFVQAPASWEGPVMHNALDEWKQRFDTEEGGPNHAPKFPLPNNYLFLLKYAHMYAREDVLLQVETTLKKMAFGGIYDQVGGGFARYSTDMEWKVPHFEKMLYDNAQLVSLYALAFQKIQNPIYKQVVYGTIAFIDRELTSPQGLFYSALDADSEGEEGKFYVWSKGEIEELAGDDFEIIADYYNVNRKGLWEEGKYILLRDFSDEEIAEKHHISAEEVRQIVSKFQMRALQERETRPKPGLDDKSLTSWNALMVTALADAYMVFREERFLKTATTAAGQLLKLQKRESGLLWHNYKDGRSTIDGFLDDYAFLAKACIRLYEATFDEKWLLEARALVQTVEKHFEQNENGLYKYVRSDGEQLVVDQFELHDNVIPASNSVMATNLFRLGLLLGMSEYLEHAENMLSAMVGGMQSYPEGHSQWMQLYLMLVNPVYEIAVVGQNWREKASVLQKKFLPNVVYAGGSEEGSLELLKGKSAPGKTMVYVCEKGACKMPVEDVSEALRQMGVD